MTKRLNLDCILPQSIIAHLACPRCKNKIAKIGNEFKCGKCNLLYPIVDGVPVLINEENSLFSIKDFTNKIKTTREINESKQKKAIKKIIQKFIPKIGFNLKAEKNYSNLSNLLSKKLYRSKVLVIGGGEMGKGMKPLINNPKILLIESDVYFGERNKIISDAHDLPFISNSFDAVIIQAVLEHVVDPRRCVEEIKRVLKKWGVVYAETPFMQQVHENEFDFTRFTLGGHRRLFRYFKEIDSGVVCGPGMALAWSIDRLFGSFSKSKIMTFFRFGILPFFIFWLKYFDYYLIKKPWASDAASGIFFMGIKSDKPISDKDIIKNYWRNKQKQNLQQRRF